MDRQTACFYHIPMAKSPTILIKKSFDALSLNSAFFGFFAHSGFVLGLKEIGFKPAKITGSSSGALIGSLIAAGIPPEEITRFILTLKKKDFWEGNVLSQFIKPFRKGLKKYSGFLSGKRIRDLLEPYIGGKNLKDFPTPIGLAVSNLTKGIRELRTEGNAIDLILASMTFPLLFEIPVIEGEEFLDGGVVDAEPIKELILDPSIKRIITHEIDNGKPSSSQPLLRAFDASVSVISSETRELKDLIARKYGKKIIRVITKTPYLHPNKMKEGRLALELGRRSAHSNRSDILTNKGTK
ncbi:phospholipase, patatin family [Leptospira broomii serovar Hurstbridge str. 5399]|uniref:Phospholipase, patatin family n=1 Tax=Leptospira broomii serovar Hurstbridge str. 5399 TaxID=1049789 RepID=T0FA69_9LEPT|nr:patatin-like phospholipase family protein [Leptospira broomii]EQA44791.1 phospholipase, patatin family [Leptospira broomii serovar Hurstbridge str. 5399]